MKLALKIITFILLLINGVGALYGGFNLVLYPDGSSLHITTEWLRYSPFTDFFIPGFILLVTNGFFSFLVLTFLILDHKRLQLLIIAQGAILSGWIGIQILLLREIVALHIIMGSIGIALIACGLLLIRMERKIQSERIQKLVLSAQS